MRHLPFQPTADQRANLERLAAHLDLGVTNLQFDMAHYNSECGTIGCACGHGPSLGITKYDSEGWTRYAAPAFGVSEAHAAWYWLFAASWADIDNTPRGAAARIRYVLKHGIPENAGGQSFGLAPLSYTVPERKEHVVAKKVTA